MQSKQSKQEMLEVLRALLKDCLKLRLDGALGQRMARAQGLVDGYSRALVDARIATDGELLTLIAEAREESGGAASRALEPDVTLAA